MQASRELQKQIAEPLSASFLTPSKESSAFEEEQAEMRGYIEERMQKISAILPRWTEIYGEEDDDEEDDAADSNFRKTSDGENDSLGNGTDASSDDDEDDDDDEEDEDDLEDYSGLSDEDEDSDSGFGMVPPPLPPGSHARR